MLTRTLTALAALSLPLVAHAASGSGAYAIGTEMMLLLLVGSLVALVARHLHLPYTLALVVAGVGLGFVHIEALEAFHLDGGVLFVFLLPALLFEAAFHLNVKDFLKGARPILVFAVLGVVVAVLATAGAAWAAIGASGMRAFGWADAFLFAAIIAATDPISVLALFKELGVEKRLYVLVEGESLLNDGLAVVAFLIVGAVVSVDVGHGEVPALAGTSETVVYALRTFVTLAGGGVLVGLVVGGVGTVLMRQFDDHLVEITITTVVAYGSFLLAEAGLHVNGVLATVTAGMVVGTWGSEVGMSTSTRLAVEDFWEYMAFVANIFVFLLVGLEIDIRDLVSDAGPIAAGFGAVMLGRAVGVYGLWPLAARGSDIPGAWSHVLVWGGLKGSLSMVLVLGISPSFEGRDALIRLVFGVVATSLFLQGLTMGPLLAKLGLVVRRTDAQRELDQQSVALKANKRAMATVERIRAEGELDAAGAERLRSWYEGRVVAADAKARALVLSTGADLGHRRLVDAAKRALDQERDAVRYAVRTGAISEEDASALFVDLDARLDALERGDVDLALSPGPEVTA